MALPFNELMTFTIEIYMDYNSGEYIVEHFFWFHSLRKKLEFNIL